MGLGLWADALDLLDRRYPVRTGLRTEPGAVAPQDHPEVAYYRGYCRERNGGSGAADYAAASKLSHALRVPEPPRVAGRAARARSPPIPHDATAHFLLGSLLLAVGARGGRGRRVAGGAAPRPAHPRPAPQPRAHAAAGEGRRRGRARRLPGRRRRRSRQRRPLLRRRPGAEPRWDARPPSTSRCSGASPTRRSMPPELLQRLALALAETGRADEGEALLAGRFFPREEWGTNVRQVFVEVRLQKALALARAGPRRGGAGHPRRPGPGGPRLRVHPGRPGGLRDHAARAVRGGGDRGPRRRHGEGAGALDRRRAAGKEGMFRGLPWSSLAARRLGAADEAEWRAAARTGAARVRGVPGARGRASPASWPAAQGVLLHALGREDEARARLRKALLLPDQRLSHFLARQRPGGECREDRQRRRLPGHRASTWR